MVFVGLTVCLLINANHCELQRYEKYCGINFWGEDLIISVEQFKTQLYILH